MRPYKDGRAGRRRYRLGPRSAHDGLFTGGSFASSGGYHAPRFLTCITRDTATAGLSSLSRSESASQVRQPFLLPVSLRGALADRERPTARATRDVPGSPLTARLRRSSKGSLVKELHDRFAKPLMKSPRKTEPVRRRVRRLLRQTAVACSTVAVTGQGSTENEAHKNKEEKQHHEDHGTVRF